MLRPAARACPTPGGAGKHPIRLSSERLASCSCSSTKQAAAARDEGCGATVRRAEPRGPARCAWGAEIMQGAAAARARCLATGSSPYDRLPPERRRRRQCQLRVYLPFASLAGWRLLPYLDATSVQRRTVAMARFVPVSQRAARCSSVGSLGADMSGGGGNGFGGVGGSGGGRGSGGGDRGGSREEPGRSATDPVGVNLSHGDYDSCRHDICMGMAWPAVHSCTHVWFCPSLVPCT